MIPPEEVAPEATSGKHILTGFDKQGRPLLYLRTGRENTKPSPRQVRYLVWSLERAISECQRHTHAYAVDLMPTGQEGMCIIVDFQGASLSTTPSLSTARQVASILQDHYVERLGRAMVVNAPKFISAFFSALSPFLDPVTKDKIRFNEKNLTQFVAPDQLDAQFPGGPYAYRFDFDTYWNALIVGIAQAASLTLQTHCGIRPDGTRVEPSAGAMQ